MQRKVSQFLTQCCMSNAYLMLSTCYKILGRLISNEHINLTVTFYRCLFSLETLINFFFVHVARLTFVTSFTTLFITLKCMISYCRQEKFSFVLTWRNFLFFFFCCFWWDFYFESIHYSGISFNLILNSMRIILFRWRDCSRLWLASSFTTFFVPC